MRNNERHSGFIKREANNSSVSCFSWIFRISSSQMKDFITRKYISLVEIYTNGLDELREMHGLSINVVHVIFVATHRRIESREKKFHATGKWIPGCRSQDGRPARTVRWNQHRWFNRPITRERKISLALHIYASNCLFYACSPARFLLLGSM